VRWGGREGGAEVPLLLTYASSWHGEGTKRREGGGRENEGEQRGKGGKVGGEGVGIAEPCRIDRSLDARDQRTRRGGERAIAEGVKACEKMRSKKASRWSHSFV